MTVSRLSARGAVELSNEDFLLSGVIAPDDGAMADVVTVEYAVFDARLLSVGTGSAEAALGHVQLILRSHDLQIVALRRMEIASGRRQRGAGRRLIQALAASTPGFRLNVQDIPPAALDFWIALGCSFQPSPDGRNASYTLPAALRPTTPVRAEAPMPP